QQGALDGSCPLLFCGIIGSGQWWATGVIHHNIETSEVGDCGSNQVANGVVVVEVTGKGQHIRIGRVTNLVCRLLQVGLGPATYSRLSPFFGKYFSTGPAQPFACSTYDDHLVLKSQIHSEYVPPSPRHFPLCLGVSL